MTDHPIPTKRRQFLATAGLATAAASLPTITRAQDTGAGKLKVGIIGCGGRCDTVASVAVKDGRFGVPAERRFTGLDCFKRMLDAGGIDIVAVLSPPYFHPEQVEAAVEAGHHVWLAKPIAVDAPGVARIEAAARRAAERKRCFLVDFQTRALAHYPEAARRVAAGDLGTLGYGEIEGTCPAFEIRTPTGPSGLER